MLPHTILSIGDTHEPFVHPEYYDFLVKVANEWSVDTIVHQGDEGDFHNMSLKFAGDPDGYSPGHEYELMIEGMQQLYKKFPNAKVCKSNHTWRPFKKAFAFGIPKVFLKQVHQFMEAPKGWEWADEWVIDGVLYIHGEGYTSSSWQRAHNNFRRSVVMGHVHAKAGVVYSKTIDSKVFSLNVGCGINEAAYSMAYGKTFAEKPVLGCGIIVDGREGYFIPMPNQNGVLNKIARGALRP